MTEWDELWAKFKVENAPESWYAKIKEEGDKMQSQINTALQGIEEWCSDCLKPKYACPSCIYQLTKEELGYRPRLSRGETSIDSDSKRKV